MKGLYNKSKKTNLGNGIQGTSIAPNGTGQDIYGGGTSN
jgi:hypothetical protein